MQKGIDADATIPVSETPSLVSNNLAACADGMQFAFAHASSIYLASHPTKPGEGKLVKLQGDGAVHAVRYDSLGGKELLVAAAQSSVQV